MNPAADSPNPDIRGTWPAMLRASSRARELAIATGTPFYIMRDGKIVDGLAKPKEKRKPVKATIRRPKTKKA